MLKLEYKVTTYRAITQLQYPKQNIKGKISYLDKTSN